MIELLTRFSNEKFSIHWILNRVMLRRTDRSNSVYWLVMLRSVGIRSIFRRYWFSTCCHWAFTATSLRTRELYARATPDVNTRRLISTIARTMIPFGPSLDRD